ncbi:MAG: radical SAM protein [Candidatus Lernaella stagnicola]|nr:radical SAM protein [Candidatus Lernaella stagnicola]
MNSRPDILLIQPPLHLVRTDLGASQVSPNIGLAYIAACQRQLGRRVMVIDAHALNWGLARIISEVRVLQPRLIGLSAMTYQILQAAAVAEALKREFPDVPVLLGGAHSTSVPERTLEEFPAFDAVLAGEGEITTGQVLEDSEAGRLRARPGVYVHGGDVTLSCQEAPPLPPLDELPHPAFDLFPLHAYWPFYSRRWIMELPLSSSRGCPWHCTFCTKVMGDRVRFRSPESLLEETARYITDYGLRQVIFTDENFTHKESLVHGYCEGLLRRGIAGRVRLICQSRVTLAEETIALMARAGFTHITFGVESGDQEILDRASKGIKLAQSRRAVEQAKKHGMIVDGNFILGLPYETEATVRKTIDFACSLPLDYASFFLLVPYPGSEVMAMARRGEGYLRLMSDDWKDFGKQTGGALELTSIGRKRLEKLQFMGYLRFYGHPKRWLPVFRKVSLGTVLAFLGMRVRALVRAD